MGDSDEEQEMKRHDRDKFKRERECSEKIVIPEAKRRHSTITVDENFKQKVDSSQNIRPNKRYKRSSQEFQNIPPYLWQPFEVPSQEILKRAELQTSIVDNNLSVFLMSFKQFIMQQDDSINEVEAVNKYNEYKQAISAQYISSYFEEHKDEQWFQEKYHPYYCVLKNSQRKVTFLQRFVAFWLLYENFIFGNLSLDVENISSIESIIDISLVLMEYTNIYENTLKISDSHRKFLERMKILNPDETMKPDTTSNLPSEDGEITPDRSNLHPENFLPASSDPFLTSIVCICGLPLSIQRERLETVCKPFGRILRIFLTDPTILSTGYRNCTVTFSDNIDTKALVSNIQSNFPKQDYPDILISVSNDRIPKTKSSVGICNALEVVISDLHSAVKVVQALDAKEKLFLDESWVNDHSKQFPLISPLKVFSSPGLNPLLLCVPSEEEIVVIKQNLAAAEKAEEEEEGVIPSEVSFRRNLKLLKVLDELILYLRIVHSFDFYSSALVYFEDLMSCRLSQVTVRGPTNNSATNKEVFQHITDFSASINNFLVQNLPLTHDEMILLSKRNGDECIEKFIQDNTKMIDVEKYLCPLSGKKFKGPEYVRKHIHNKHKDKIDEVVLEVQYFNNYLTDRNRPMPKMKNSVDSKLQSNSIKQDERILALMSKEALISKDGNFPNPNWPFHPNLILPPHGPPFHHSVDYPRFPPYSNYGNKRNPSRKIDDNRKPISYKDWDDPNLDN